MVDFFDIVFVDGVFVCEVVCLLVDCIWFVWLVDVVGQENVFGFDGLLGVMLVVYSLLLLILWGLFGVGKIIIVWLLVQEIDLVFVQILVIFFGVLELCKVFDVVCLCCQQGWGMFLFVDEIYCFNKVQQDSFLLYMEDGIIVFVGVIIENFSFELNVVLMLCVQVIVLKWLDLFDLECLVQWVEQEIGCVLLLMFQVCDWLLEMVDGDGCVCLNLIEQVLVWKVLGKLEIDQLLQWLMWWVVKYDKLGDEYYNLILVLYKLVCGSDLDVVLYWFVWMLEGGEDLCYLVCCLICMVVEDIGLVDFVVQWYCFDVWVFYEWLGSFEGELVLV